MGTYCNKYKLNVTYLDCMECENKCNKQKGGEINLYTRYLKVIPKQHIFMVFASKREGYTANIVIEAEVTKVCIESNIDNKEEIIYTAKLLKVVSGKSEANNLKKFIKTFCFKNSNVDTGIRVENEFNYYPVFTNKGKCIEWLKGH